MQQNNNTPKTAVIMPAYNSGATIEASVRSILNQTVSNLVLIVVDDGRRCLKSSAWRMSGSYR